MDQISTDIQRRISGLLSDISLQRVISSFKQSDGFSDEIVSRLKVRKSIWATQGEIVGFISLGVFGLDLSIDGCDVIHTPLCRNKKTNSRYKIRRLEYLDRRIENGVEYYNISGVGLA